MHAPVRRTWNMVLTMSRKDTVQRYSRILETGSQGYS